MTRTALFSCLALALSACARPPAAPAAAPLKNVLIVTIDTLRADRVGVYGALRQGSGQATSVATPNMDRLAREGAWAPQADAHVPLTRPSHVSLFTGRYPAEHGVRDNIAPPLAADVPLLSERFQRSGIATAAFIASVVLERQSGLARGFDQYFDQFAPGLDRRPGDQVVAEAIAWMQAKPRFFAWVHLYDPHAPYLPPGRYAEEYAGRPYDGTVAWCDELVGRLVDALRQTGTLDNTLLIVTSDHGEALGDHGEDVHGYFVYEATLRVPLIVRGPGVRPGTRIEGVARTVDLFPTIVEMSGVGGDLRGMSGQSLAPALAGSRVAEAPSFGESLTPLLQYGWSDLRAVRDGRWKYILAPKAELYDLDRDPGELHNLADAEPGRARALRGSIEARLKTEEAAAHTETAAAGVSPEALERLGALGYVGPGASPGRKSAGADPKDKLADYKALRELMQEGLVALRAGRAADAIAPLQGVARRGVDSFELHYYLARTYAALERWRDAAAEYDHAVARMPAHADAWRGLGESRVALHDGPGAVRAFEKLVPLVPLDPVARMQLGESYRDIARYQDAARVIREALALDPKPSQYWNSLGTVLGAGRQMAEAERAFAEATNREPANGLYAYNRGLALQALGRRDEAGEQFRRAVALGYTPARR